VAARAPAQRADAGPPAFGDGPAAQSLHGTDPARAPQRAVAPDAPRRNAAPAAAAPFEPAAPAPFEPSRAAPLSPAALAQRAPQRGEDNQVVHVSIGRIDVVATVAPTPAAAPAPKPRSGTVPLADYLRGENRSRR
jgi:hypothetical protein